MWVDTGLHGIQFRFSLSNLIKVCFFYIALQIIAHSVKAFDDLCEFVIIFGHRKPIVQIVGADQSHGFLDGVNLAV